MERLHKIIANSGYTSRRRAEELIKKGKVFVDGKVITDLGTKVSVNAKIKINGTLLETTEKVYYILNKPRSIISSSSDDKMRKTVVDFIDTDKRIYPVGRLDYNTTGLILLTNDGFLSNLLTHPKNEIEKVYIAKINGILNGRELKQLKMGVLIDNKLTSKAKVKIIKIDKKNNTSLIRLTIYEGRNHQVKKMFESLGYEVKKLKREKLAFLTLDGLKSSEYRKLNNKEVHKLYNEVNKKAN